MNILIMIISLKLSFQTKITGCYFIFNILARIIFSTK